MESMTSSRGIRRLVLVAWILALLCTPALPAPAAARAPGCRAMICCCRMGGCCCVDGLSPECLRAGQGPAAVTGLETPSRPAVCLASAGGVRIESACRFCVPGGARRSRATSRAGPDTPRAPPCLSPA